jgi:hypothetical protein
MATSNTKTYAMKMVLEYAKVFKENADYGDAESAQKWLRDLAKNGGQTAVNAYFTSEEQLQGFLQSGYERMATNPKTNEVVDTIKEGNQEYGIGKYLQLKRKITDVREYKDRKTGEFLEVDFGGIPTVIDIREGEENKRLWDYEGDGELGHGTEAYVEFEVYKGTSRRLKNLAVVNLVEYEGETETENSMFKVGS